MGWEQLDVYKRQVLGELKLDKDYDTFEGEIQWCGQDVLLSLEVNAESKPAWTRARSAAKKLLADCETWDKAMRELAAKNQMCIRDRTGVAASFSFMLQFFQLFKRI